MTSPFIERDYDHQDWASALRPKVYLLANHLKLQELVESKLILDWSPEQISGWLKNQFPEDESMRVSHETIYRSLFIHSPPRALGFVIWIAVSGVLLLAAYLCVGMALFAAFFVG